MTDFTAIVPPVHNSFPAVARGVVAKAPASIDDPMTVTLVEYSNFHDFDVPVGQWMPKSVLPVEGDQCVVVIDDHGDAWVPLWGLPAAVAGVLNLPITADLPMNNHKITTLLDPTAAQDAATKHYVDITGVASVTIEGWHDAVLQNGWANYGTGFPTAAYKKYPDGRVRLRGLIRSGTATSGTVLFSLPVGYRPVDTTTQLIFPAASTEAFGEVRVASNGDVAIFAGSNTWISLDGIEFDTGQALWPSGGSLGPAAISARIRRSTPQSIPNGGAAISFDVARWDSDTMWSAGTPTRLTVRTAGMYAIGGSLQFSGNAGGSLRLARLLRNGTEYIGEQQAPTGAGFNSYLNVTAVYQLAAGDYIELIAYQDSGTTISTNLPTGEDVQELWMARIPGAQGSALGVTSALPLNPVDGQECYYLADATNGIVWHLKYRAASTSAFKWEAVGEPTPLSMEDNTSISCGSGSGYAAIAGSITLPLAGDYIIEMGGRCQNVGNNVAEATSLTVRLGAAAPASTEHISYNSVASSASQAAAGARKMRRNGLATAAVLQFYVSGVNNANQWDNRFLFVRPVRVG